MRIKFLCPQHREALLLNPDLARDYWLESQMRVAQCSAELLPCDGPSSHLVAVAGSALEAANIYLQARPRRNSMDIRAYAESAITLIRLLVALGQTRLGLVVVAISNAVLEEVARHGADAAESLTACERLTKDGMALVAGHHSLVTPG